MSGTLTGYRWRDLPGAARVYVALVIVAGAAVALSGLPHDWPQPTLFLVLLGASCFTSSWKVNLPIPISSGSTLSVSYAANLTALLALGPAHAMLIAMAGVWTQCTVSVKARYPWYRTVFSLAAQAITMWATGAVYIRAGGIFTPTGFDRLPEPLVAAIATYFLVNTGLIATAIAWSKRQSMWRIWREDFLWSGASFIVAGTAGAAAAVLLARGAQWQALLLSAPVYVMYRTYQTIVGRLDDQRLHLEETRRLHDEAVTALAQAQRAEQALTDEKERLAVTLRSIADGVIATDAEGTIQLMNQAAALMTGWSAEAAIGRPLASVFRNVDPDTLMRFDHSPASIAELSSTPASSGIRRCSLLIGRDLSERPIEESAAALRDDRGRPIGAVLVFRDITGTLRIQEDRAKANKLSALGVLAGGMSHDYNNLIMEITGHLSMARATMIATRPAAAAIDKAEAACRRARQLTWQLLTFSKGGIPAPKLLSLAPVLDRAIDTALRGSSIGFTLDVDPDLWTVYADEAQISQALTNVLTNAIEGMPGGGIIQVRACNVIEGDRRSAYALRVPPGRFVSVSISDQGTGIAPEHVGRIFDPYFTTKGPGSGLGLATTHSVVKNHGGFLAVDSALGRGTTVRIDLRAAEDDAVADPIPRAPARGRGRVLVMEAEESIRTLAANMLDFLGYHVETVANGRIAVDRVQHAVRKGRPYDVVMLDLWASGGTAAADIVDDLARLDPAMKVVIVSGDGRSAPSDNRGQSYGATIEKPFTLQQLNATMRSLVSERAESVH